MEAPIVVVQSTIARIKEIGLNDQMSRIECAAPCREQGASEPGNGSLELGVDISTLHRCRNAHSSDEQAQKDVEELLYEQRAVLVSRHINRIVPFN